MACKRIVRETTNQPSQLFDDIYNKITKGNEILADELYSYFKSDTFKDEFGDWINDFKLPFEERTINQRLIDDNGEPRLFYDDARALHYYRSKTNTKVFFGDTRNQLTNLYSYDVIRNITKILAINYLRPRISGFYELDISEQNGTLSESIRQKIVEKSIELQESEDFEQNIKGRYLEQSLDHLNEWVRHVENFYRELKLVYREETATSDMSLNEISTREGQSYGIASFERSSKENIGSNVKLRLSLLQDSFINNKGELEYRLDESFYEPILMSFDEVYSSLQSVLTDQVALEGQDMFDIYTQNITDLSYKKPFLNDLLKQLSDINDYDKAEFIQAFNLHKNNFIGTTIDINPIETKGEIVGYETNLSVVNLSNSGGRNRQVKDKWHHNFIRDFTNENSIFDNNSETNFNILKDTFDKFYTETKRNITADNYNSETFESPINSLLLILNDLGIETTENGFNHFLDGLNPLELSFDERVNNFNKLIESTKYFLDNFKSENIVDNNPFDTQSAFNNLAIAEAYYISEGSDSSFFSVGKSKWIYSFPSYLSTKVLQWKKDRNVLLDHYYSTPYNKGSYYMYRLLALDVPIQDRERVSKERIDNFELNIFNSLQSKNDGINSVDNTSMSKNDAFADNFNKILGFRIKSKPSSSYASTPAPADKGTQHSFTLPIELMIDAGAVVINGKVDISTQSKKIIYNYIKSEYNRILQVKQQIEIAGEDISGLYEHYHTGNQNGLKFQLFESLNEDKFDSELMGFELYDENGIVAYELQDINDLLDLESLDPTSIEANLIKLIDTILHEDIVEMRDHLYDIGMIDRIDGEFVNKAFDTVIWDSYKGDTETVTKIAADIVVNNLMSQVEFSKMFSGDVAYYRDMNDYKKRVPATYSDGLQLYIKEGQEKFTASIIQAVRVNSPFHNELVETLGKKLADKYIGINSTDAQAWITPARWKFLKEGLGQWSPQYDVVFDKIEGRNNEPFTKDELLLAAQPLKGVYFEINNGVPTFLKYSQAVLSPRMLQNSPGLAKLAKNMIDNNIDELITIDGIKVGANQAVNTHNEDGSVKDDIVLNKLELKNSGWKLQQDLPTKTFTKTDLGSQLQKNIFAGIAKNLDSDFNVDGTIMNGNQLINHIHKIINNLSDNGLNNLLNEFGVDSNYKITNIDRLNKSLIEELKSRGSVQNVIDALENGITSYAVSGQQEKIQNVFASMVLKRIIKVQTNGGSFIQMANYGFSNDQANSNGVIYTPWAETINSEPKFLKNERGSYILSENGKKIVKPGGILIPGSFIAEHIPNYREFINQPDILFGAAENNYRKGMIDSKILQSIIGYRIPNQGLASNDALEVVGILPEEMGDTIVAYTGITTKTGSDFDIDKMFIMMPTYRVDYKHKSKLRDYAVNSLRGDTIQDTINNIDSIIDQIDPDYTYDIDANRLAKIMMTSDPKETMYYALDTFVEVVLRDNNTLSNYIKESIDDYNNVERLIYDNRAIENDLIQAYKSVLTNPDNINDIMNPIDHPFIKDDILNLFPEPELRDGAHFNIIHDINTKYEFLAGQAGVGITANQLVDHMRGLMADLGVSDLNLIKIAGDQTSKLDNEFSRELSDKELAYYSKEINEGLEQSERIDVEDYRSIKIADSISAVMNANVDIANDSYITRGNWNTQTSNVGLMLLRSGLHPFRVNAILGQPIIKEYVDFTTNSESKITNNTGNMMEKFIESKIMEELSNIPNVTFNDKTIGYRDMFLATKHGDIETRLARLFGRKVDLELVESIDKTIQEVVAKYKSEGIFHNLETISLRKLRDGIKGEPLDIEIQMSIFNQFTKWNEIAKDELGLNIRASKVDTDGYGKNITSLIMTKNVIDKLMSSDSKFKGFGSKLVYDGNNTFLAGYINNGVIEILKLMEANPSNFLIAHPTIVNTFNTISKGITGNVLLQENLGDKLERSYYSYFMSGFQPFQMDNVEKNRILDQIPQMVINYKRDNSSALARELSVKTNSSGKPFVTISNRIKSVGVQTEITNAWNDLLEDNPDFGTDLIKYAFLTSGLQMTMSQFHTYIPYQFYAQNNINDYVEGLALELNDMNDIDHSFIDSFFRHNVSDNQIVRNVFDNQINDHIKNDHSGFVMAEPGRGNLYVKKDIEVTNPITHSKESFIQLFKLEGYNDNNQAVYTRAVELGTSDRRGYRIYEYSFNNNIGTIVEDNNINNIMYKNNDGIIIDRRDFYRNMTTSDQFNGMIRSQDQFTEGTPESSLEDQTVPKKIDYTNNTPVETIEPSTQIENDVITPTIDISASWSDLKNQEVFTDQGVNTMRTSNKEIAHAHFGNPFSASGYLKTIKMPTVEAAVQAYKNWLTTNIHQEVNIEQKDWILEQINSGKLDGANLLYDSKLNDRGKGNHANALAEVVSELRGENINNNTLSDQTESNNNDPFLDKNNCK